jgi:bifunctional N-acetylglucosamine-1-phosphate-uridyltransferase/glucosamine-1-phosphate-acetyltransferase GlmU-like protein
MLASDLFDPSPSWPFGPVLLPDVAPWDWLKRIPEAFALLAAPVSLPQNLPPGLHIEGPVWIHPSVKLPPFGSIKGPVWIGEGVELRPGVYLRGNVIVGAGSVLGNSCEFKNCILLDGVQCPHFNYVGDSILGRKAHLGAGVILSNLRFDQGTVFVKTPEGRKNTGLRKLGALLGDEAEVGCNASLQPGTLLGRRAVVGPCCAYGGTLADETMVFSRPPTMTLPRRL